jgi:pimeloyl-ACP methyl ester carboxylesterase
LPKEAVVLVHGLWVNGFDMSLLRQRLRKAGYTTHQFSYNSVTCQAEENAEKLGSFVQEIDTNTIHFVGHSLGGIVIRHLFHQHPEQKPGRVVTLGTPHQQSQAARQLSSFVTGKWLLGKSIEHGLLGELPKWQAARQLGSVAGTLQFGMGIIIPGIPRPNDGTVAVEETRLEGMVEHLTLSVSHFGLLLSTKASDAVAKFLREGKF